MGKREEAKKRKEEEQKKALEEYKKEREAISKRKSVRVVANEHGTNAQILNWMLKKQGRFTGEPGRYFVTPSYKQYEHYTQEGYGNSYDPPFFEGIDFSREAIRKAEEELKAYRKNQKAEAEEYWKRKRAEESKIKAATENKTPDDEGIDWLDIAARLVNWFFKK